MRTTYISWFNLLLVLSVIVGAMPSCKEDENTELNLSRMFMPSGEIKAQSEETYVKLTWKAAAFTQSVDTTVSYTVEVSRDSLFQGEVEFKAVTDTTGVVITEDDIAVRRKFYARIKTNNKNSSAESKWLVSSGFSIRGAQLLLTPRVVEESAILRWQKREGLSKIVISPESGSQIELPISNADSDGSNPALGAKRIDGLTGGTKYTAELFGGKISMGIIQFRTQSPVPTANLVDLSGVQDPEILTTKLKNKEIPAGATILLARGATYNISSEIQLDRSISIVSKSSFDSPAPVVYFTSNFNIEANANIDSIVFRNVTLRGSDYSSKYAFNVNTEGTVVGKMVFEYCNAETFRGFVRLQNKKIAVGSLSVNNSVISNIGNYGVINVDGTEASLADIAINNSTIYKVEKVIVSKQNSNTVSITSTTVHNAPIEKNYLIDYSQSATSTVSGGIKLTDCIIGAGNLGKAVNGIRASSATTITTKGTYSTSDYKVSGNAIPNLLNYSGTSADLFADPENGDFTIKDPAFSGRESAGDPRWR